MSAATRELIARLAELFSDTGAAHHQDYLETDGADPEWPIYYADRLQEPLNDLLGTRLTKSELVYLLVRLSHEQPLDAPGASWQQHYARSLVRRYRD